MGKFRKILKAGVITLAAIIVFSFPSAAWVLPDLKSGFAYNLTESRIAPCLSVELWEHKRFCFDFGLFSDTIYLDLAYNIVPIMEIAPFVFYGYNINQETWVWGFGLCWIKW